MNQVCEVDDGPQAPLPRPQKRLKARQNPQGFSIFDGTLAFGTAITELSTQAVLYAKFRRVHNVEVPATRWFPVRSSLPRKLLVLRSWWPHGASITPLLHL